jgi:hypothetical protein
MQEAYVKAAKRLLVMAESPPCLADREQLEEIFDELRSQVDTRSSDALPKWWIYDADRIHVTGIDLLEVIVEVKSDSGKKELSETIEPPFDAKEIMVEEYGGERNRQQSICITIIGEDVGRLEREAYLQLEIDSETGEFKESSLHDWDIIEG